MNIQRRQLILTPDDEVVSLSNQELGRLDILDELFNALHGVGDVDRELKEMVLLIVAEIHNGGHYFSTTDSIEKKEIIVEIIKVIYAALHNRPAVAEAVLQRWMMELEFGRQTVTHHELKVD